MLEWTALTPFRGTRMISEKLCQFNYRFDP
jgi:hypothetical protein